MPRGIEKVRMEKWGVGVEGGEEKLFLVIN